MGTTRRKRRKKSKKGVWNKERSPYWWFSYVDPEDSIQKFKSTGTANKLLAEKMRADFMEALSRGKILGVNEAEFRTFDELMTKYCAEIIKKDSSKDKDKGMIDNHLKPIFGGLTLDMITKKKLNEYKSERLKAKAAPAQVRNELRLLGNAMSYAVKEWEWIEDNPVLKISFKNLKAKTIDRWLTIEEEKLLMAKTEGKLFGELADMVIIAHYTGMSEEEVLSLRRDKVDLARKVLVLTRQKTETTSSTPTRTIPINRVVYDLLRRRIAVAPIDGKPWIFRNEEGGMINRNQLYKAFKNAVKESGIVHCRFHDLRHSFASRLVQRNVSLWVVAKLLGHSSTDATQRYAHHYPEGLREGIKRLDHLTELSHDDSYYCEKYDTNMTLEEKKEQRDYAVAI